MLEWWEEYRYRTLVSETHQGFLDTPSEVVRALIMLDGVSTEVNAELIRRAREGADRGR